MDGAASAANCSAHLQEGNPAEPIEKHDWLRFARRVELVLLQEPNCKAPVGTLAWLNHRPLLTRHHHVRLNHASDVARLCRWIAGKAVGLVLSGAAPTSRALTHLRNRALTCLRNAL
jgi:hypothetical protein